MKKSLAKNSVYNVIYKGFTALFPLITTTYISRVLLADGVGKVSYASTIVSYFAIIAALGLPQYGVKVIAQNYTLDDRSKAFSELFFINLFSSIVCIIAYYSMVNLWGYFSDKRFLLNVMGIQLILNIFNIDWFYQGIEEYGYITTRSIIIKILSFIAMIIFVNNTSDYVKYGFILCMATAGNNILNVWNLRHRVHLSTNGINVRQHLKPVIVLLAASLATEIYTMLDTIMIEHFHGDVYVGLYSNSVKIVRLVHTLSIALVATFYPRISYYLKGNRRESFNALMTVGVKIIILVSLPAVVGIELLSDQIVPVMFGSSFLGAIPTLRILAPLILIFSVAYFMGHIVLIATNNESRVLIATVIGAIVNFSINLALIPSLQQNGAAIASVAAELLITVILLVFSHSQYKLDLNIRYIGSVLAGACLMGIIVYLSQMLNMNMVIGLLVSIIVGIVSYVAFLILFKNDTIIFVINYIWRRFNHR